MDKIASGEKIAVHGRRMKKVPCATGTGICGGRGIEEIFIVSYSTDDLEDSIGIVFRGKGDGHFSVYSFFVVAR